MSLKNWKKWKTTIWHVKRLLKIAMSVWTQWMEKELNQIFNIISICIYQSKEKLQQHTLQQTIRIKISQLFLKLLFKRILCLIYPTCYLNMLITIFLLFLWKISGKIYSWMWQCFKSIKEEWIKSADFSPRSDK